MAREYSNDRIVVTWEPELCIHTGNCVDGAPQSFDRDARPWINVEGADADHIAQVVARCPSGALHVRRLDGGSEETPDDPPTVRATRDGPLHVRGAIELRDEAGGVIRRDVRLSLCRCGASAKKPFCDNTHLRVGFKAG